jgi:hypothetical protein
MWNINFKNVYKKIRPLKIVFKIKFVLMHR